MHLKTLPKKSRAVLATLTEIAAKNEFILAGGTSLALQVGHRLSEDFDFFSEKDFSPDSVLEDFSQVQIILQDQHSLVFTSQGVKISYFRYWDGFLFEPIKTRYFPLAHPNDIALMKLVAVANRGSRKDFIDLFFIFKKFLKPLEALALLEKKFPKKNHNAYHILKSLCYFDDAEKEPMPKMLSAFDWKECRDFFVKTFAQELKIL